MNVIGKIIAVGCLTLMPNAAFSESPQWKRWSLEIEGGYLTPRDQANFVFGYPNRQPALWAAMGYRINRWAQIGWEGGTVLPDHQTIDQFAPSYIAEAIDSSFYTGGYGQALWDTSRLRSYVRMGAGVSSAHHYQKLSYYDLGVLSSIQESEYHIDSPAIVLALGVDWKLKPYFSLGVGLRDVIVFRYDGVMDFVYDEHMNYIGVKYGDRTRLVHVPMPFVKATVSF